MTISAKIIADSIGVESPRLTTLQLRYPKFIHGEFMTHRVFSRNASSSRAIPVQRLIQDVIADPVYPSFWGRNQPGMQAGDELDAPVVTLAAVEAEEWVDETLLDVVASSTKLPREAAWDEARYRAIAMARAFADAGYHKQVVNRLLEPFCHINVLVTSVQWSNFFALRRHPDAQPEMRELADAIFTAMQSSEPVLLTDSWHLPYVEEDHPRGVKLSVARCARVSYQTSDGTRRPTVDEDLALYDRLLGAQPIHASPAEHQALPDPTRPHLSGNLTGWVQYRKTLEGECQ